MRERVPMEHGGIQGRMVGFWRKLEAKGVSVNSE